MNTPQVPGPGAASPVRSLSLFDATSIVVGIIIGATIYQASPAIARSVPNLAALVGIWLAGGLIALFGALCYAELATRYPQSGGNYVYLTRAFGRRMGALYAWAELCVVRPGSIGAIAFVFARYANELVSLGGGPLPLLAYAVSAIAALTLVNLAGLQEGKWTQNLLTTAKVLGLLLVFGVAILAPADERARSTAAADTEPNLALAFILVMFAYGGWNEVSFVAAEVRQPRRNLPRTLLLGIGIVTTVYVLVNLAFAFALSWEGFRASSAVASEVVAAPLGEHAKRFIGALICITTLGAINGQIFAGARIYYAFGRDHRWFALLGRWNGRTQTPSWALVVQGVICLVPVVAFGRYDEAFDRMVIYTTPVFWFFFLLVGASLFVLRGKTAERPERLDMTTPFLVPLYPATPLLFMASSLFMLYASFTFAVESGSPEAWWSIAMLAVGYLLTYLEPAR